MTMKRMTYLCVLLCCVFIAAPVHAQKLKDAFLDINEKTLRKEYSNLAMLPVVAASSAQAPDAIVQLISNEVREIMADEDFTLLPPEEVAAIRAEFEALYSAPATAEQQAAISEHAIRELFHRHPVAGLLSVHVLPVGAPFRDDKAEWAGTAQKIEHTGDGFFGTIMGTDYGGTIAASAVRVIISDRAGKPLYNWMGGVEVMMMRNGESLEPLPPEKLWQSRKRVEKAVSYALKPL